MGTRADFYIGIGNAAEWIGSVTYDGYPDGNPKPIFKAKDETQFRNLVSKILAESDGGTTTPDEGAPWPWEDSRTTDYAYAWHGGEVLISRYGAPWATLAQHEEYAKGDQPDLGKMGADAFPNMKHRQADTATILAKSGLIFLTSHR